MFFGEEKIENWEENVKGHGSFVLNHGDLWGWRLDVREWKGRYFKIKGETGF